MKIVVNNIDPLLRVELSRLCDIVSIDENPDGAFIQWTPATRVLSFESQTNIVKECLVNDIPLIVFDKYQEMTEDEIIFFIKPGVFLWEPALNNRAFFSYQPVWGRIFTNQRDIPLPNTERKIDLGYYGSLSKKVSQFEDYYKPISDVGTSSVAFVDDVLNTTVNEKVMGMGVPVCPSSSFDLTDVKITVLLGTELQCSTGCLDDKIFRYLEAGVIPLLPVEHRWHHSSFTNLVVSNNNDIEYILKTYDKIAFGLIYDVYQGLNNNLPEADVVNVAQRITNFLK